MHLKVECECSGVSRNTIREPEEGTEKGMLGVNEVYVNNEGGNEYIRNEEEERGKRERERERVAINGEESALPVEVVPPKNSSASLLLSFSCPIIAKRSTRFPKNFSILSLSFAREREREQFFIIVSEQKSYWDAILFYIFFLQS